MLIARSQSLGMPVVRTSDLIALDRNWMGPAKFSTFDRAVQAMVEDYPNPRYLAIPYSNAPVPVAAVP